MAQLPEFKVTCKNGHSFATRARGSSSVSCPVCKKDGCRVSVWVPKDRPKTIARIPRGAIGQADAELTAMTKRWAAEPEWNEKLFMRPGRAGLDECPECRTVLQWEPGRTLTFCDKCKHVGLPPAVAAHYARVAERRGADVATRTAADPAAQRAARVRLRALANRTSEQLTGWMDVFDPDELTGSPARLARDYRAELAAYLPEIKHAASEAELTAIMADIAAVTGRAEQSGALAAVTRQREAIEREAEQDEQAEYEEEIARQEEAERERQERADAELARRQAIAGQEPRQAIAGPPRQPVLTRTTAQPYTRSDAVNTVAYAILSYQTMKQDKARRLEKLGACAFPHRKPVPAERLYGIQYVNDWQGTGTGSQAPGTPEYRACSKHFADADKAINNSGFTGTCVCYWELKA